MDEKLREFLDLVDCRPEDVKNIPPGRLLSNEDLRAECNHIDPEARQRSLAEVEVYFGKHKGAKLGDVPVSYLRWVLGEKATNSSFRKFQDKVRQFLGGDHKPAIDAELRDPLRQKFLSIVKNS